jgi:hypothetical protein
MIRYINRIPEDWTEFRGWAVETKVRSDAEAWEKLQRVDWMLLLVEERGIKLDEKKLRHFAADCAEDVLPIFEWYHPNDGRPRNAIQAVRDYADKKIEATSMSNARLAAASASARAIVLDFTDSTSAASASAAAAWAAAMAAMEDATAAVWAVSYAAEAVFRDVARATDEKSADASWRASMSKQADRLRKYFKNPFFEERP